jgi:peptidoglycan/LPS O-acetylase OafA/YrhL
LAASGCDAGVPVINRHPSALRTQAPPPDRLLYPKLQALRGIAACVLVFYKSPVTLGSLATAFMIHAYLFVDLFFVLSGFVLCHAYGLAIGRGLSFGRFMGLRLARVYPLHLAMLLAFVAYELLRRYFLQGEPQAARSVEAFLSNLLLIQSLGVHDLLTWNTPSWSISVELYTYVLFFVALKTLDVAQSWRFPLIVVLLAYGAIALAGHSHLNITYDLGFVRCVGGFYLGILVYRTQAVWRLWLSGWVGRAEWLALIALGILISCSGLGLGVQYLAILGFAFAIAVFALSQPSWLSALLCSRPLQWLGDVSYSIYMVHYLVWVLIEAIVFGQLGWEPEAVRGFDALALNSLAFGMTLVASAISYRLIEVPPRQWLKARFARADSAGPSL